MTHVIQSYVIQAFSLVMRVPRYFRLMHATWKLCVKLFVIFLILVGSEVIDSQTSNLKNVIPATALVLSKFPPFTSVLEYKVGLDK